MHHEAGEILVLRTDLILLWIASANLSICLAMTKWGQILRFYNFSCESQNLRFMSF
ncbi:hypothetical protein ACWIUD_01585 [Helicobacter sp. 23-1044]